jgi:hypothetical protein
MAVDNAGVVLIGNRGVELDARPVNSNTAVSKGTTVASSSREGSDDHGAYKVNGMVDEAGVFAANALSAG